MNNIKIEEVRNCYWYNEAKTLINCEAQFSHIFTVISEEVLYTSGDTLPEGKDIGDVKTEAVKTYEWLPFLANPNDVEAHGRKLYANAVNGDYGEVAEFEHPSLEKELSRIRERRNHLLKETDWTRGDDVPQATKDKFTTYRQELRDMTEGIDTAEKARAVVFPTKP
jgi:hypothetical protein|tara:strand:+ start:1675 stop:2175 length:501 start_codon:yes stop_codon:yes gene_type:complete